MEEFKKYIKEWQELTIKMNEAIQNKNFELSDKLLKESTDIYNKYKTCSNYPESNKKMTFGELNYMLESELPRLFKKDRQALKECTLLIKNDNNLRSAFRFMDALRKYNCEGGPHAYISECLALAAPDINRSTFRKSVNKFAETLAKHEIGGYTINEEAVKYFKDCEKMLMEEKKLANLSEYTNTMNSIASYIEQHKTPITESKANIITLSEELEKKIANLTEEEQSLVQSILDFKKPAVESRHEQVFNRFKNECLDTVSKLMKEADDEEKESLTIFKEQLENKTFCEETIVQDIAKLLEIRDVLMEN